MANKGIFLMWQKEPVENYLDEHLLYRAVSRGLWETWQSLNIIDPNFFNIKNAEGGLSFDWSKYSTPQDTLNRRKRQSLRDNGIVQLNIGELKLCVKKFELPIKIEHDPKPENQAHTLLHGITKGNKTKIRRKLSKIAKWAPGMKPTY